MFGIRTVNQFETNQLVLASGQFNTHNTISASDYDTTNDTTETPWKNMRNAISIFKHPHQVETPTAHNRFDSLERHDLRFYHQ